MDKSIMAMADDILGGALSNPAKAQSQLSNPYNEPELPELSDTQRESMMNESTNHLNEMDSPQSDAERARKKKEWEEKNRAKRQAVSKPQAASKPRMGRSTVRRRREGPPASELARRARARLDATQLESAQIEILLKARDILREVTSVGAIGVGPQVTGSRGYSTHGADMGKDTVKVQPVDKALRKTEKGKSKKKKVKKESFDLFLDRIINENQETK